MSIVINQKLKRYFTYLWRWFKTPFFKNRKKEPEPPIQFEGLIKRIDKAQSEFTNSSAVEGLTGGDIVPLTDLQQEVKEIEFFARKNNIQEDIWDAPRVYKAGEIIDEESGLRAVITDMDYIVFEDDVEMVGGLPKAAYAATTASYTDYNKTEGEFDPKKFVFSQPYEITRDQLIAYLKGHAVPFEVRNDFSRFGRMNKTSGGWHQWVWHEGLFSNATEETLYEVYLQLRVAEHKQQTELFMTTKLID